MKLCLLFFILYGAFVFPQDLAESEDPITRLSDETKEIKDFVFQAKKRDEQIKTFKIKFTNLITDLASQDFYKLEYQQSFQEVNELERKALGWSGEEKNIQEKNKDLMNVVEQSLSSYKESVYTSKGELRYELSQNIKDLSRIKSRLINYQFDLRRHRKGVEHFLKNINDWKKLLKAKMAKSFNQNFTRWELNGFLYAPIKSFKALVHQTLVSFETWQSNLEKVNWKKKMAPFFLILALIIAIFWVLFFAISKIKKIYEKTDGLIGHNFLGRVFQEVLNHKSLMGLWGSYYIGRTFIEKFFTGNPYLVSFVILSVLLIVTWLSLKNVLKNFLEEIIGEDKPASFVIQVLIFLCLLVSLSRIFQSQLYINSELMIFVDNLILCFVSFQFSSYLYKNLDQKENSTVTISTRFIALAISITIFSSCLLEFIGFVHLSRIIQEVVMENAMTLIVVWFLFGVVDNFLRYFIESFRSSVFFNVYSLGFITFIKDSLNTIFIIALFVIIIRSWMKNVFVFSDFWNIELISFESYQLKIKQPIQLLIMYYFLKALYLGFKYIFYSFLLKSLKIERKNAPNIMAIVRYLLIFLFISVGLGILGFTYKNILIFASALGVGIGFGLQNIVNNFLSGIILLFEQPVRVGDIIEVNGILATVVNIGIRSTIVESYDNSAIIIPNSEIVSNNLINWTLQDNVIAVECYVGVAYGTDTRLVSGLILEALKANREILDDPPAQVWFKEFGESSLDFTVRFWINKPRDKFLVKSKIMHEINSQLEQHNIVIPFPQRDIHIHESQVRTKTIESDDEQ